MGDGGAERDRGSKRREEPGGRSGRHGDHGGTEHLRVDAGSGSPREVATTSASSPAGSRESGGDSDGQPALGETDHCRRILVRGKGTAAALVPWATILPFLGASDLSQFIYWFFRSVVHPTNIPSAYCVRDIELNAGDKAGAGRSPCFSPCSSSFWAGTLSRPTLAGCYRKDANQSGKQDSESQGPLAAVLRAREEKVSRALCRDKIGRDPSGQLLKKASPTGGRSAPSAYPSHVSQHWALHGLESREGSVGGGGLARRGSVAPVPTGLDSDASPPNLADSFFPCSTHPHPVSQSFPISELSFTALPRHRPSRPRVPISAS